MSLPHNCGWRFGDTTPEEYIAKLVDDHDRVLLTVRVPKANMGMWVFETLKFVEQNFNQEGESS